MKVKKLLFVIKRICFVISLTFWTYVCLMGLCNVAEMITKNPSVNFSYINLYYIASGSMSSIDESNRKFLADKRGGFLQVDDVVVVKRLENERLKEGDIVTFLNESGLHIVHRIYKIKNDGVGVRYFTRGDANNAYDPEVLYREDIKGLYLFRIPYMGEFFRFLKSKHGLIAVLSIIMIRLLYGYFKEEELKKFGPLYYSATKNLDGKF